jgi:hypothetical protein
MPDYMRYLVYGLLTVGIVGCLGYIANSFEGEDVKTKDTDQSAR